MSRRLVLVASVTGTGMKVTRAPGFGSAKGDRALIDAVMKPRRERREAAAKAAARETGL